ncbi:MAG: cysteine desulfurase, partial [Clostridia bacterium]|nr:cysteine desulfurase [Clostridia bacterium]
EAEYGNPSTLYSLARNPRKAVDAARNAIAALIGASPKEIYFTSGGTEADNWALKGTAFRWPARRRHIICSAIEHHAVLNVCDFLTRFGYDVTYLPVDSKGLVSPADLKAAIRPETILVSIMTANNEIGTVEPVQELSGIASREGIPFHTDAVQAVGHIPISVEKMGIQMLSASAHKFGGPKGVGFLYVHRGIQLEPLIHGGGQEMGWRSGTENVAGIVGMAAALTEHVRTMESEAEYLEELRTRLMDGLTGAGIDYIVNGAETHVPGSLSVSFRDTDGEMILHRLDLMGIAVATGSACNSRETVLSHVMEAIHVPGEYARGTVRITLGMENSMEEMDRIAACIAKILQ